jgi:hypothetical protein
MKVRNGFVSNSSSSSYLLAYKPGEDISRSGLVEALGARPGTPAEELLKPYVDFFLAGKRMTKEDLEERYNSGDRMPEKLQEALGKGWEVIHIRASNEDNDPISYALHYGEVEIDMTTLMLMKEY